MTVRFDFNFDGYGDFDDFLDKHEEVINMMGSDAVTGGTLVEQMRKSVQANEQLPEYFEFTDTQYAAMVRRNGGGMTKLSKDSRVSVSRPDEQDD